MASFKRLSLILTTSCAGLALAACDGASSVASPGAGSVVVNPPAPAPTPTPGASPTPTPITAAQFAANTNTTSNITVAEQLALITTAPSTNNNADGTRPFATPAQPFATANTLPTATDPTTLNAAAGNPNGTSFFQPGTFLGAFSSATDTSFQGWTCNSGTLNFGSGTSCAAAAGTAAADAAAAAALACPTGTTAATVPANGVVNLRKLCSINTPILTNVTLPNIPGIVYRLDGPTEVGVDVGATGAAAGGVRATLTIAPGVVIAANSSDSNNDVLLVNRGSRIEAVGTATQPIIFTAQQNLTNNNVGDASQGLWGGVILLGQAPTGVCQGTDRNDAGGTNASCQNQIEGVATPRFYGGTDKASDSGRFQYVQIRYSGVSISEGNELQGLTLGGTGTGTLVDHVQSHNSADDGIEIFGGTTNLRYIAITGADDDGLDYDNGYRGNMQFVVLAQKLSGATNDSFSFEIDSDGNEDFLPRTFGLISNFTIVQTAAAPAAIRLRGGADTRFVNGIVQSSVPCLNVVSSVAARTTVRAADAALQDQGPPVFNSIYFACNGR